MACVVTTDLTRLFNTHSRSVRSLPSYRKCSNISPSSLMPSTTIARAFVPMEIAHWNDSETKDTAKETNCRTSGIRAIGWHTLLTWCGLLCYLCPIDGFHLCVRERRRDAFYCCCLRLTRERRKSTGDTTSRWRWWRWHPWWRWCTREWGRRRWRCPSW